MVSEGCDRQKVFRPLTCAQRSRVQSRRSSRATFPYDVLERAASDSVDTRDVTENNDVGRSSYQNGGATRDSPSEEADLLRSHRAAQTLTRIFTRRSAECRAACAGAPR